MKQKMAILNFVTKNGNIQMASSRRNVFKNIGYLDYIFSFSNYRPVLIPEVTLLSPKTALNFRFRLGKAYLLGYGEIRPKKRNASKTGSDVIIFSTSLNPAMFGTIGFVSKRRFQKYIGKWD